MSEGITTEGMKLQLLRCNWEPPEALEAPSPCPQGIWRPFNTGREKKGRNCVCVWGGGAGRAGRGAHVPETPKPQRKGACRRVGRERGWVEGGRYGAWVWLSKDRVPLAEAPQVGSRLGLRSADWRGWEGCM